MIQHFTSTWDVQIQYTHPLAPFALTILFLTTITTHNQVRPVIPAMSFTVSTSQAVISTVAPHFSSVLHHAITTIALVVASPQVARPTYTSYYDPLVDYGTETTDTKLLKRI